MFYVRLTRNFRHLITKQNYGYRILRTNENCKKNDVKNCLYSTISRNTSINQGIKTNKLFKNGARIHPILKASWQLRVRAFRTTPRHDIPPVIWMLVKPMMKLGAILSGRGFRNWWRNLPVDKKSYFIDVINKSWHKILGYSGVIIGLFGFNYIAHLQEAPITKRKRFIAFTPNQFEKIMDFEYNMYMEQYKANILPPDHPSYARVVNVANQLIGGNQDVDFMRKTTWGVIVVDEETTNAFVLPNGHIFVFSGLLNMVKNDDQLAAVISHEMSHAVLGHGAEQVSFAQLVDMVVIVAMAAIWAFMPSDGIAIVSQWFYNKVIDLTVHMPYSRKLETEADDVGLTLAAKACFDIRECSAFWMMMNGQAELQNEPDIEFLSTHPSHQNRAQYLDDIMNRALSLRSTCGCPSVPAIDPRNEVQAFLQAIKEKKQAEVKAVKIPPPGVVTVPNV